MQRAQELVSHSVPTQDVAEFLKYFIDKVIRQKTTVRSDKVESKTNLLSVAEPMSDSPSKAIAPDLISTATVAVKSLSTSVRKKVLDQQRCCQYKDPVTGRTCQSKWFSQTDHKHSKWAGGTNVENLQILCAGHNQMKYRKEVGIKYRS